MDKEILHKIAVDKNGNWIYINNAEKGIDYYCPLCKKEFILRKSGKTGKGSRRSHFAHNELTPNCTPEGVLHYLFKKKLIDLLEKYKAENKPFIFNWHCVSCGYKNLGNLLEKVTSVKEEYTLGECRPDIALLDKEENVLAVIEIVVTHEPEEGALQYYKEKKIILIRIDLTSEEDLQINLTSEEGLIKVEEKVKNPDIVDLCMSPKCRDKYKINKIIKYFWHECGRGLHPVLGFKMEVDSVFGRQPSSDFTEEEMNWIKSKFNNVETRINHDTKGKYPRSICLNCQRMGRRYGSPRL